MAGCRSWHEESESPAAGSCPLSPLPREEVHGTALLLAAVGNRCPAECQPGEQLHAPPAPLMSKEQSWFNNQVEQGDRYPQFAHLLRVHTEPETGK